MARFSACWAVAVLFGKFLSTRTIGSCMAFTTLQTGKGCLLLLYNFPVLTWCHCFESGTLINIVTWLPNVAVCLGFLRSWEGFSFPTATSELTEGRLELRVLHMAAPDRNCTVISSYIHLSKLHIKGGNVSTYMWWAQNLMSPLAILRSISEITWVLLISWGRLTSFLKYCRIFPQDWLSHRIDDLRRATQPGVARCPM